MFEFILKILLKYKKLKYLKIFEKSLPKTFNKWQSNNNLWHYACFYQSTELLDYATNSNFNFNINQFNKRGLAPLHCLIENSFFKKKNIALLQFNTNQEFLEIFLKLKPDVNLLWNKGKTDEVRAFSKNNISGTPLEILIMLFWKIILTKERDDFLDFYLNYEMTFLQLCEARANVNLIFEGEDFGENDTVKDAMQKQNNRIMSHFFTKFINNTKDLYAIYPFFKNHSTDFYLKNEQGNNLIHILFSCISQKNRFINEDVAQKLILDLYDNPNFNHFVLLETNNFLSKPSDFFKKESNKYKLLVESYLLKVKLNNELKNKTTKNKLIKI